MRAIVLSTTSAHRVCELVKVADECGRLLGQDVVGSGVGVPQAPKVVAPGGVVDVALAPGCCNEATISSADTGMSLVTASKRRPTLWLVVGGWCVRGGTGGRSRRSCLRRLVGLCGERVGIAGEGVELLGAGLRVDPGIRRELLQFCPALLGEVQSAG